MTSSALNTFNAWRRRGVGDASATVAQNAAITAAVQTLAAALPVKANIQRHLDFTYVFSDDNAFKELHATARLENNVGTGAFDLLTKMYAASAWFRFGGSYRDVLERARAYGSDAPTLEAVRQQSVQLAERVGSGPGSFPVLGDDRIQAYTPGPVTSLSSGSFRSAISGSISPQSSASSGTTYFSVEIDNPEVNDLPPSMVAGLEEAISGAVSAQFPGITERSPGSERAVRFTLEAYSVWGFSNANIQLGARQRSDGKYGPVLAIGYDAGTAMVIAPKFEAGGWLPRDISVKAVWVNGKRSFGRFNPAL